MKLLRLLFKLVEAAFRVDVDRIFGMLANVESLFECLRCLGEVDVSIGDRAYILGASRGCSLHEQLPSGSLSDSFCFNSISTRRAQTPLILLSGLWKETAKIGGLVILVRGMAGSFQSLCRKSLI